MSLFHASLAIWLSLVLLCLNVTSVLALPRIPGVTLKMAGDAAHFGDGAYPRATYLKDGSILGVHTGFEDGNNILNIVKSSDNGASWTEVGSVTKEASNSHDLDNGFLAQLSNGKIVVAYRNHDKDPNTGAYTHFRITLCSSDDMGKTWSFLSQAAEEDGGPNGIWEPFLRATSDGALQVYYSRENSEADQDILMKTSKDGGQTWGPTVTVIGGDSDNRRDGMPGVTNIGDSSIICIFETSLGGIFSVQAVASSDNGATWGPRQEVYKAADPKLSAQSPQIVNTGGVLVASFMTNEDTKTKDESVKAVTSSDNGKTWGKAMEVAGAPAFWPGLVPAPLRTCLYLYGNGKLFAQKLAVRSPVL